MKIILLVLGLFGTFNVFANPQFMCDFGSEVRLSKPDIDNPTPVIDKRASRYIFMVNKSGTSGSYKNRQYGYTLPMVVYSNGSTITFIEKNTSNNLFIVTAFLDKQTNGTVPAVFTQNGWTIEKDEPDFQPRLSLGSCVMTSK